MKKKSLLTFTIIAVLLLALGQTVWAFKDVKNDPNEAKITELKKLGLLSGVGQSDNFNPQGNLNYASGISLIVRGLDLNLDHVRFIKEPKATDSFPNLKDDAWYSQAFVIAAFYGLEVPKDVKANDVMTREQFAHHLFKAISTKGDYAFIEIFMMIADEADVNTAYMDSIQKLLISKIAQLDSANKFYPKKNITRGDAAGWLYDSIQFVKNAEEIIPPEPTPDPIIDAKLTVAPVNGDVNKVTVTAQVPHPGYGIRIASIAFEGKQAILRLEATLPDPDKMYPQVITDVQVSTYVDAAYEPVIASSEGGGTSDSAGTSSSEVSPVS
ncbi:S-layer homology domain-containing protein [Paenibacillus harenae]|uniref:S-layer homology domain-containing protein n=1 Tax=Paenibacillus harenae TaxID=306543 RepID=UPI002792818C|nr:S-layer homology domain-containing protein [Paenibacillus harenae]MDQ0059499.1 hypothetical protein [Paenibacillus harenae]